MGTARTKANNKWNVKAYDRINLTVQKGQKDAIKAHAESHGKGQRIPGIPAESFVPAGKDERCTFPEQ